MLRAKFVLLPLLCAVLLAAQSDQEFLREYNRFKLFNACRPMRLVIARLHDDTPAIGLTENALQAAAESRLRVARLYTEDKQKADTAILFVNVNVFRRAFSVDVQYLKLVTDAFGATFPAVTRSIESTGMHGGDAGYIVQTLSQDLDKFLADYLRVNEAACESR